MAESDDRIARWNRYWDKKSRTYDREIGFFDRHLFGDSRQWVCSQASGNTLEVAIGTGLNLSLYPDDVTLTGIDWSEQMLDLARQRAANLGRNATLQQADAHRLPFGELHCRRIGLLHTEFGQIGVELALHPTRRVVFGLPVPQQDQASDHRGETFDRGVM